jgi:hypothetical protein
MGSRPSERHSLDRKNNSGNYTPRNCRWATPEEQQGNTRNNRIVEAFGERKILSDWAREIGIPLDTLWRRLSILKWSSERALSTALPAKKSNLARMVRSAGYASVSDFLRQTGNNPATLYKFANGKPMRPATRARIALQLGVE